MRSGQNDGLHWTAFGSPLAKALCANRTEVIMNIHGEVSFVWDGDLLKITAIGPFNEEGLNQSISTIQKSILNKNMKNWRRMEIWDDGTLSSPEGIFLAKEAARWYKRHGCYAVAIVFRNILQKSIIETMTKSGIAIFKDTETAIKWLDDQCT